MNYWVFTDEQLEEALSAHWGRAHEDDPGGDEVSIVREFLRSDACRERGMLRGEESSDG